MPNGEGHELYSSPNIFKAKTSIRYKRKGSCGTHDKGQKFIPGIGGEN
jgi:hypothetical protein